MQRQQIALFRLWRWLLPAAMFTTSVAAETRFPEPVFVSLRDAGQVARFPGPGIWAGGPKMLYTTVTPDGGVLAVSSPVEGSIHLFDSASGQRLARIVTGKAAKGLKASPDGREIYVCNEGADTVSVVDVAARKTVATIATGKKPHNVQFSRDGRRAYVTLQGGDGLGVIDTRTRRMTHVIPTPGIAAPHNLDLSADGRLAFIRGLSGKVGVLEIETGIMKAVIPVGRGHAGIDITPDGRLAFTGAIADEVVTVIDAQTLQVLKQIKVGFGPHGVRASRDGRYLYVAVTADDRIAVIDIDRLEVIDSYHQPAFPFWLAVPGND